MANERRDVPPLEDRNSELERGLIEEFLRIRGYTLAEVNKLPEELARPLLKEASTHAAAKLTEIESRSHYLHEIHGVRRRG